MTEQVMPSRGHAVAARVSYSTASCYSGNAIFVSINVQLPNGPFIASLECQLPSLEDHLVGRECHEESSYRCMASCWSGNQEMGAVFETLQRHFQQPTSDSMNFYGLRVIEKETAVHFFMRSCLRLCEIQMAIRTQEAIQIIVHQCAASRQRCLPAVSN